TRAPEVRRRPDSTAEAEPAGSLDDSLPLPAVNRPLDRGDADAVRLGVASRLARGDDAVAELERRARHRVLRRRELRAGTPLQVPGLGLAVLRHLDADERVRVAPDEFLHHALDLDALARLVRRSEGMMRENAARAGQHDQRQDKNESVPCHGYLPPRLLYAASTNMSVVHGPVVWPNRGS